MAYYTHPANKGNEMVHMEMEPYVWNMKLYFAYGTLGRFSSIRAVRKTKQRNTKPLAKENCLLLRETYSWMRSHAMDIQFCDWKLHCNLFSRVLGRRLHPIRPLSTSVMLASISCSYGTVAYGCANRIPIRVKNPFFAEKRVNDG